MTLKAQSALKKIILFIQLFSIIILIPLLVWLVNHPEKPEISITLAHVDRLNLTRPSTVDSSIHPTIRFYNPNYNTMYYEDIFVLASYNGQNISTEVQVPAFNQDYHEETNNTCAHLVGNQQIVGNESRIQSDLRAGKMELSFVISGKLRWGIIISKSRVHMFTVNCVAIMPFGSSYVNGPFNCSTTL
ncbi:hypothetical protein CASFOL_004259 [Castilleja foliolosa]|uniref:Late embryogenesis abundant protein LEA-2 subgroup domain-containing protein n=1 Tax=Castilleja foliolosa TaxID=1961234 RepID=A0ABD3EAL1_9LAMI